LQAREEKLLSNIESYDRPLHRAISRWSFAADLPDPHRARGRRRVYLTTDLFGFRKAASIKAL
jgi:hypothetical protein